MKRVIKLLISIVNIRNFQIYAFNLLDLNLECGNPLNLYWFTGVFFEENNLRFAFMFLLLLSQN